MEARYRHPNNMQVNLKTKADLLKCCYSYLYDNFHKFNETNKIKIALAIVTKDIPNKVEHSGNMSFSELAKRFAVGDTETDRDDSQELPS